MTVLDFGRHEGAPYVGTGLREGETLRQVLARGPLEPAEVLRIGIAISEALGSAHEHGIVHRDLKPENLMRLGDGRIKVLDFGIAKLREPRPRTGEPESLTTQSMTTGGGALVGTVGYMSPEQVRGEPVDARSDLFSLGAILHELVAGKPAFAGAHHVERMMAIVEAPAAALPAARADEPPSLRPAIARCLAKAPADRFASARELCDFLLRPEAPSRHGALRAPRRRWPQGLARAAMGPLALALGAGGYWLGGRRVAEPEERRRRPPPPRDDGGQRRSARPSDHSSSSPFVLGRSERALLARAAPYGARWGGRLSLWRRPW